MTRRAQEHLRWRTAHKKAQWDVWRWRSRAGKLQEAGKPGEAAAVRHGERERERERERNRW